MLRIGDYLRDLTVAALTKYRDPREIGHSMVGLWQRPWRYAPMALALAWGLQGGVIDAHQAVPVARHTATAVFATSRIPAPPVPDGLGLNIHWTNPRPGEMRMLAATGVRWIRMDFSWAATERKKGRYNFAAYTRLFAALRRYHIRQILIFDYGNPLYQHGAFPTAAVARHAFATWAATAVRTFCGCGVMWEMYNEPNDKVTPAQYARLAVEVGRAVHQADPHALYVGPALLGMDGPWLKQIMQDGVLKEFDAITVHPYRQTSPETVAADYKNFRRLVARYAPAGKLIPLISGEWGYSTTWMKRNANRQGKYLAREFLTNLMCHIPLSIWYDWHNDGAFGLHHEAGSIKFSGIATATSSEAKRNLELFAKGQPWTFSNGPEFPGARGSFRIGQDNQTPVGRLGYNFSGGGNYVDAGVHCLIRRAGTLSFKVRSKQRQQILVRVVDHSGQCLQFNRNYSKINHWQAMSVNLARGSSAHWGGENNGVADFPIVSLSLGVNNSYPVQERHFGIVKYAYHPHRHWVYTPKPAFFACRTLTHTLRGFHFEKCLKENDPTDFVLVFAHGRQRRWVAWSAVRPGAGRGVVALPVPPGIYRVINYIGSEHIKARATAAGLRLQLSTGPQYVIPSPATKGRNR